MRPLTYPISKPESKSSYIKLCDIPHENHSPKQGNPYPNYKTNSHPSLLETTHQIKDNTNPQSSSQTPPRFKSDLKPHNISLCKSPHTRHVFKKGKIYRSSTSPTENYWYATPDSYLMIGGGRHHPTPPPMPLTDNPGDVNHQ